MTEKLILALPSKGRMMEQCTATFARAGLLVAKAGAQRGYRGEIVGSPEIEVHFVSSSEIAQLLPGREPHSAGVAVAASDRAPIAAAALRAGVDCLLASDPLFDAALRQRVASEIDALALREQLAQTQQQFQRTRREVDLAAQTQSHGRSHRVRPSVFPTPQTGCRCPRPLRHHTEG